MSAIDNARAALTASQDQFDDEAVGTLFSALEALITEHERARDALTDMAEHGLRFDLNPTLMLHPADSVYQQWASYARRMDASIRERAAAALTVQADRSER